MSNQPYPGRNYLMLAAVAPVFTMTALSAFAAAAELDPAYVTEATLPLQPENTIRFTTDEGTWISVDLSPDRRTILFDLLGDLYVLPVEGGKARRIVSGLPLDHDARFSPDGKSIVFVSDRNGTQNIWIAAADGTGARQVTNNKLRNHFATPVWTADGKHVIAARSTNRFLPFDLWMYPVDGGTAKRLTHAPEIGPGVRKNVRSISGSALEPTVSADGKAVFYAKNTGGYRGTWKIIRLDLGTGTETIVIDDDDARGGFRPWLGSDGEILVYGRAGLNARGLPAADADVSLHVRNLTTGADHVVLADSLMQDQGTYNWGVLPGYAFLGKDEILIAVDGKISRVDLASGETTQIPFEADVALDVNPPLSLALRIDDGPTVRAKRIHGATESPDGNRLAFSSLAHIYLMDLPSGSPARLTTNTFDAEEYQPTWSPDGSRLVYVSWSAADGCHVWIAPADGRGAPVRISSEPGLYMDPVWSADGARILVMFRPEGESEFHPRWFAAAAGAADSNQAGAPLSVSAFDGLQRPHFTATDNRIYFSTGGSLVSTGPDGTGRASHFEAFEASWREQQALSPATDVRISPDGQWALAYANRQLYLLPLDKAESVKLVYLKHPPEWAVQVTDVGADDFGWSQDGSRVTWSVGSTYFRADVDTLAAGTAEVQAFPTVVEVPRTRPDGTLALTGAKIVTMADDNKIIKEGDILIRNDRIVAVGARGEVAIPSEATTLDMRGRTIIPGMFDIHGVPGRALIGEKVLALGANHWQIQGMLALGVTTIRGANGRNDDFVRQDLLDAGVLVGPRLIADGEAVHAKHFRSFEEARNLARKYTEFYGTHIVKTYLAGNRRERQWWALASQEYGLMITGEMGGDMRLSMTYPIDGFSGFEHPYPAQPFYKDLVELVARSGMFWDVTLMGDESYWSTYYGQATGVMDRPVVHNFTSDAWIARAKKSMVYKAGGDVDSASLLNHPYAAINVAETMRAGGRVVIGSHGEWGYGRGYTGELWVLHARGQGLKLYELLQAATINSARAVGYGQDLGSLEQGKIADLAILSADPLERFENFNTVEFVMTNGALYEAVTLDAVWPAPQ